MDMSIIFYLSCFLAFIFLLYRKTSNTAPKLPPGPWKLPVIGSILHLAGSELPHRRLRDLARKHGPLMHLKLGEISALVVSSPSTAKEVLKVNDQAFADRPMPVAVKIMSYDGLDIVFASYGNYWRQMRKVTIVELLSAKNVRSFTYIRENEVHKLISSIASSAGRPVNLTEKVFLMSSAIIFRAACGKVCKGQDTLIKLIKDVASLAGGLDVADLFPSLKLLHFVSGLKPKLVKMHKQLDDILESIIQEHLENQASNNKQGNGELGQEDLIDVLLRLKESGTFDFPINIKHVKALIFDMFSGGTETSSTAIEWAMSELMRNPEVMEKAQAEVRKVLQGKETINESDIQGLNYLKLVIKETLRLHPPFPMLLPRECREQCVVNGYTIPVKTKIFINAWAIGRDPKYWPDAEKFMPERFENDSFDFTGNKFEYLPFGSGRRSCSGMTFGLANVELPLAQLLYHFDWKLPEGISPSNLDMTESFGAVAGRRNKLYLIANPHSS